MGLFGLFKTKDKEGKHLEADFLKQIVFLEDLNYFDLKVFSRLLHQREYRKGEVIFREGYPHAVLYIVKSGKVEIVLERDQEKTIKLAELTEKAFFGEIGLFIDTNRTATAVAAEETILLAISKIDFKDFIDKYPRIGVKVVYELGKRLSDSLVDTNTKLRGQTDDPE